MSVEDKEFSSGMDFPLNHIFFNKVNISVPCLYKGRLHELHYYNLPYLSTIIW
jgi:hypothetical protein